MSYSLNQKTSPCILQWCNKGGDVSMSDEQYIRDKIDRLRLEKNLSERKLSLELGHGANYINAISSGRALPSMGEFLYLCEYFGITALEFFDTGLDISKQDMEMITIIKKLDTETKQNLYSILKKIKID